MASLAPTSVRILEIGCGDGMMAAALQKYLPAATILGIDPGMVEPGRMFDGDRSGVTFERAFTSDLIARGEPAFDLVLVVDVLHHVADGERQKVVTDAAALTLAGGTLIVKEWEAGPGLAHKAAFLADRYVSGDSTVRFMDLPEIFGLLSNGLDGWQQTCVARIPPRRANICYAYRRNTIAASAGT